MGKIYESAIRISAAISKSFRGDTYAAAMGLTNLESLDEFVAGLGVQQISRRHIGQRHIFFIAYVCQCLHRRSRKYCLGKIHRME